MTTSVTIRVNGRYRAKVQQDNLAPVEIHGNYDGSPNKEGEHVFHMSGPHSNFSVIEEPLAAIVDHDPDRSPEPPRPDNDAPAQEDKSKSKPKRTTSRTTRTTRTTRTAQNR